MPGPGTPTGGGSPAGRAAEPQVRRPESAGEAAAMALAGLRWLAGADLASVPAATQADCLRDLEQVQAAQAAASANALGAFCASSGYEDDGHGSPRTWLTWQTRVTRPAASAALAAMRRLRAHRAVAEALRDGAVSASWARQVCEWTDRLPEAERGTCDAILLAAAAGGADLADLAALAEEMLRRLAGPDRDPGGFLDRSLRLSTTLGGAGRLSGDLTPQCAAALRAVLDALGKKAGPQDTRTCQQREHDALEEACRRLVASGCLPDRAGQPLQIQLNMTLEDLARGIPGDDPLGLRDQEGHDGGRRDAAPAPWPAAAPGHDCDASIAPIVTGRIDHDLLDRLAGARFAAPWQSARCATRPPCRRCLGAAADIDPDDDAAVNAAYRNWSACRRQLLATAVQLLSGPGGVASALRTGALGGPAGSVSLPLDLGTPTDVIPPHLRRAVIARDRHCRFPGCDMPPAGCQVHHIKHRRDGGLTKLPNLLLLCSFHHLILVHRWGWTIDLNADGTTTARSPNGANVIHSHSPPPAAAA